MVCETQIVPNCKLTVDSASLFMGDAILEMLTLGTLSSSKLLLGCPSCSGSKFRQPLSSENYSNSDCKWHVKLEKELITQDVNDHIHTHTHASLLTHFLVVLLPGLGVVGLASGRLGLLVLVRWGGSCRWGGWVLTWHGTAWWLLVVLRIVCSPGSTVVRCSFTWKDRKR